MWLKSSAILMLSLLLPACGHDAGVAPPPVVSVAIDPPAVTFTGQGQKAQFRATVTCAVPVSTRVTWRSSNPQVATVDSTGTATAVAAGTTSIVATSVADTSAYATATVIANLHSIPVPPAFRQPPDSRRGTSAGLP